MRRSTGAILSSSALAVALALTGCGAGTGGTSTRSSDAASATAGVEVNGAGAETTTAGTNLFADGTSPTVSITWNDDDYAAMIGAYEADGSKDWIKADITIDGTLVSAIGVRLKGNSTLRASAAMAAAWVVPATFAASRSPVLNEALALALTAASGQATQRYASTTYSINGSATQSRLLVENPDEAYADSLFDTEGVLYKADAESSFTYQGDDPGHTIGEQFKQLNATGWMWSPSHAIRPQ